MELIRPVTVALPDGMTETNVLNVAVQVLTSSGDDIESKDVDAHVLTTKLLTGQTVLSTCRPINIYRAFRIRVSVIARGCDSRPDHPATRTDFRSGRRVSVIASLHRSLVASARS